MDLNALPFDADAMLRGLRPWVECESPTFDPVAVSQMVGLVARDAAQAGAWVELIPGVGGFGDCARIRFPHPQFGEPGILVLCHLDTVHPKGTLATLGWRRDGERCYGPGALDMKGGTYLALEAVRQLQAAAIATPLPVTFLLTSDEEVGTPVNRALVEAEAARCKYALLPEPARERADVATGRYAIARFNLTALGRPSHAGASLSQGRSAVRQMARRLIEIEEMTDESCTYSVSVIRGGQWANCVPSRCEAESLSMAKKQEDLDRAVEAMLALSGRYDEVDFHVERGVTRPVWEPNPGTTALFERAAAIARPLGLELAPRSVGGGSDGNFTGAMGVPTLDGLGPFGAGAHTLGEYLLVPTMVERGRLFAGLLATLD